VVKKKAVNPLKKVVAAVMEKDSRVLIARRKKGIKSGGLWEFPGGRLEAGETPEKGLEREIAEELGVAIKVKEFLRSVTYRRPALSIKLLAYRASLVEGEFSLTDHDEIRWVPPRDLNERDFAGPDRPIVRMLKTNKKYEKRDTKARPG
jgi:8-oxo-dGTP diphosphatase